jgi:AraC family transcriptional regulator
MDFGPTGASCLVIEIDKQAEGHLDRLTSRSAEYFTIPWLGQLTGAIDRQARRLDSLAELTLEGHLVELVAQLSRLRRPRALSAPPPWLRSVRDMLHAHPGRAPTGEALAAFTGAHRVHVLRSFRDHFGVSIGQYARRIRLQRAHQLLIGTALPLAEVAQEAGFADQAHLSRVVRSALGLTPAEIRRASGGT